MKKFTKFILILICTFTSTINLFSQFDWPYTRLNHLDGSRPEYIFIVFDNSSATDFNDEANLMFNAFPWLGHYGGPSISGLPTGSSYPTIVLQNLCYQDVTIELDFEPEFGNLGNWGTKLVNYATFAKNDPNGMLKMYRDQIYAFIGEKIEERFNLLGINLGSIKNVDIDAKFFKFGVDDAGGSLKLKIRVTYRKYIPCPPDYISN